MLTKAAPPEAVASVLKAAAAVSQALNGQCSDENGNSNSNSNGGVASPPAPNVDTPAVAVTMSAVAAAADAAGGEAISEIKEHSLFISPANGYNRK